MRVHGITIFADKSFTPQFDTLSSLGDVVLRIHTGDPIHTSPRLTIFFADIQEATNLKNAVVQSWEMFLKREAKEKS